ncbi:multicomponent Na+:H+ antiporter subunit C [Klenkia marina]|uniref:Multicomponent Na+:H+ antiporter subunit C n=1 Tax=Klenkia marina TaxID=1960309 RepID=A0A1G4XF59_9ACTN|nr:cation:proton antiporter subunit C [Klenkia marina]SCX39775.1 multicomponent Na+:H+ antiporter subunit C [Klenkia marina]
MTAAVAVGLLVAGGSYLVLQRGLLRVVLGFVLLGHAMVVLVLAAGGDRGGFALPGNGGGEPADPLPQAFVLTAVVIAFAVTVYLLGLLRAGSEEPSPADDDARGPS